LAAQSTLVVGLGGHNERFAVHPLLRDLLLHPRKLVNEHLPTSSVLG